MIEHVEKISRHSHRFDCQICTDREEPPDPAGLCDGVDYSHQLQIRLENDGTVSCFWNDYEHPSTAKCVTDIPYKRFYAMITTVLKQELSRLKGIDDAK